MALAYAMNEKGVRCKPVLDNQSSIVGFFARSIQVECYFVIVRKVLVVNGNVKYE